MAEEKSGQETEEEFHFGGSSSSTTATADENVFAAPADKKKRFGQLNIRNVLIGVGALMMVFAAYKLFEVFLEKGSTKKAIVTPIFSFQR